MRMRRPNYRRLHVNKAQDTIVKAELNLDPLLLFMCLPILQRNRNSLGRRIGAAIVYVVQSMVVTFRLAEAFPLKKIMESRALGSGIETAGRPWLGLRVGPQNRYVAVYPNGQILVAGCRTVEEASGVSKEVTRMLASHTKARQSAPEPVVQNIVATSDLGRKLNLALAAKVLVGGDVEHEQELFPGLVLRLKNTRVVVLFFGSGKFVVTGTKSLGEVSEAVNTAIELMESAGL